MSEQDRFDSAANPSKGLPQPQGPREFTAEDRQRFLRRAFRAALLIAPLFCALAWWTSRSFLLRETRFNELELEVQMPRVMAPGLPVPVRLLTTDPLRMAHRAQLKWIARDAEGNELTRGAADSFGTLDLLLPVAAGRPALLEIRASDGAWARNAAVEIPAGQLGDRVRIAAIAPTLPEEQEQLLIAYRVGTLDADRFDAACQWIAFDAMGIPLARTQTRWEGHLSLVHWRGASKNEVATRFELRNEWDEPLAEYRCLGEDTSSARSSQRPALKVTELDPQVGLRVEILRSEPQPLFAVLFDQEREHARVAVPDEVAAAMDLDWKATYSPPVFVRLEDGKGDVIALSEVRVPTDDRTSLQITRDIETKQWKLASLPPLPVQRRPQSLTIFEALPGRIEDAFARVLDPRALAYFDAPALHRTQLGYGGLSSVHASVRDRVAILAAREREELTARRIVFGVALVLAAFCTLMWIYILFSARHHRSQSPTRPWNFALGASLLALMFAMVASQLWWGTPPPETVSAAPSASIEPPNSIPSFGALKSVSQSDAKAMPAKLLPHIETDANGSATLHAAWLTDPVPLRLQCIALSADRVATHQELELSAGR